MLHRTASPLSVIGSTCTAKPRVKLSRHDRQAALHPHPLLGLGVPHFVRGQVGGHSAEAESIYWTKWPGDTCQIQFNGTTVSFVLWVFQALGLKFEWQLRVCWGRRPWHWVWHALRTQAVLYCSFAMVCDVWTGQAMVAGQKDHQLLHHCFVPEQDCVREGCMIFINLISHVNLTRLSVMYGRNQSVISRGRETELSIVNKVQGLLAGL